MNFPPDVSESSRARRAIPQEARESLWTAADGWRIRRIDWEKPAGSPRGSILFMPGRGDCYEKYLETLDGWHRQGWHVTAADWRGQAGSGRLGADGTTGHVDDFVTWVNDLALFWAGWKAATPGPHVLAAHSMGGQIVMRTLAGHCIDPDAVVLTAPMLGFLPQFAPSWLLRGVAKLRLMFGDPRTPAWKMSEKPRSRLETRALLLTHDAGRYDDEIWWKERRPCLAMGPGSWGWTESALESICLLEQRGVLEGIAVPILIVATSADGLVSFRAIASAARRLPRGKLIQFGSEARHELLREVDDIRDRVLASIDEFLSSELSGPAGETASA